MSVIKIRFLNILGLILISLPSFCQVDQGEDFDLNSFINDKLDAGEKYIVVPPGRYRVPEIDNYHLSFSERDDVTIIADSVELICTETVPAIRIRNCNNFKIRGLIIDYDPLPFTQGTVVDLSEDKRTITIELHEGYSATTHGDKVEIFDPETGELVTTTYYGASFVVDDSNRTVIISKPAHYSRDISGEEIGDIVVLDSRSEKYNPHSVIAEWSTNLEFENVTLYSGPTFGFFERYCSSSKYTRCKVDRRPLTREIRSRSIRRMRSVNADGFHSKYAEIGPLYDSCIARYNGDDGIAINGDYHVILSTEGNKLAVASKSTTSINLSEGDFVELVTYTGIRMPDAQITEIQRGRSLTDEERRFLQDQNFNGTLANMHTRSNMYYVTLDTSIYMPMGSVIASANHLGNGFQVKNCVMGPNRSRGILIKSSGGIISGNILKDNWGQAIKLAPEYEWLEAGSGSDIEVLNNIISGCHDVSIAVYSYGGNGKIAPVGAHDNIKIEGNQISGSSNPAIAITSTSNLDMVDNLVEMPDNSLLLPWMTDRFGRAYDPSREIYLDNFDVVYVSELIIDNCPDSALVVGDTYDLNRTIGPANATDPTARWISEDTSIAAVDRRGIVTAQSHGTVVIQLLSNDGNLSTSCLIEVKDIEPEPEPVLSNVEKELNPPQVYPVPTFDSINIRGFDPGEEIYIYKISGELIRKIQYREPQKLSIPPGLYFLKSTNRIFRILVF